MVSVTIRRIRCGASSAEVGRRGTQIVADHDGVVGAKRVQQCDHVLAERHRVVAAVGGPGSWCIAAHEGRDHAVARADQRRDLMPPRARVVGEAMKAEHERPVTLLKRLEGEGGSFDGPGGHAEIARSTSAHSFISDKSRCRIPDPVRGT